MKRILEAINYEATKKGQRTKDKRGKVLQSPKINFLHLTQTTSKKRKLMTSATFKMALLSYKHLNRKVGNGRLIIFIRKKG